MSDNPIELAEQATVYKLIADAMYAKAKELSSAAGEAMGRGTLYPKLPDGSEMACFNVPSGRTVVHVDVDRLLPFVREAYPSEVVETVRPSFVEALRQTSRNAGRACAPHGEIDFDGITVTQEPAKGPRITPTPQARAQAKAAVEAVVGNVIEHFARPQLTIQKDAA